MTDRDAPVRLDDLLESLSGDTKTELASMPEVRDVGHDLALDDLPISARRWLKVRDVVAVVGDLKNSTRLGTGKRAASTASIYEAATGGLVKIYDRFRADFIAIQGDGAFALFWGKQRYERAACAGITVRTFSEDLSSQIEGKWDTTPKTGFKVGIAAERVLVKRVGTPRNVDQQEPVWAGRPVNYAAKAAQGADRHRMVVTGTVWDRLAGNDYLVISCPCGGGPGLSIWEDTTIDRLPEDDPDAQGRMLKAPWCEEHGAEYCNAVMAGKRQRDDVSDLRQQLIKSQMETAIRKSAAQAREQRAARRKGLD